MPIHEKDIKVIVDVNDDKKHHKEHSDNKRHEECKDEIKVIVEHDN